MRNRRQLLRFLMLVEKRALLMQPSTVFNASSIRAMRDNTEHRGKPIVQEVVICFGNFLRSRQWSGSTPNSLVETC